MKLPTIKKIIIENISLFKGPVNRTFYPGTNMIIGGNGLGKTTIINTIIYGLVGNTSYRKLNVRTGRNEPETPIPKDYFQGRIGVKDQETAQVTITIEIGSLEITITRSLFRPQLNKIDIVDKSSASGDSTIIDGKPEELEQSYIRLIQEQLEIDSFEHFTFLISNLLVFDENRRTLVWDTETQNQTLRLLFLEREFDERFGALSTKVTELDTSARHMSERRKDIRGAIDRWLETKQKNEPSDNNVRQRKITELEVQIDLSPVNNATAS